jgi:hypothetical protein
VADAVKPARLQPESQKRQLIKQGLAFSAPMPFPVHRGLAGFGGRWNSEHHEDPWVRGRAITFFTGPEDDKAFLNQMPAKEKKKLLSQFIRALERGGQDSSLRNNAAIKAVK